MNNIFILARFVPHKFQKHVHFLPPTKEIAVLKLLYLQYGSVLLELREHGFLSSDPIHIKELLVPISLLIPLAFY